MNTKQERKEMPAARTNFHRNLHLLGPPPSLRTGSVSHSPLIKKREIKKKNPTFEKDSLCVSKGKLLNKQTNNNNNRSRRNLGNEVQGDAKDLK